MNRISYLLALPFLWLTGSLPGWGAYRLADFLFFILFYVARYRRKTVFDNLLKAFPEKSHGEIAEISRKNYQYLADLIVETIQVFFKDQSDLEKRVAVAGTDLFEKLASQTQNAIVLMGHAGNWEIGGQVFSTKIPHRLQVLYRPLSNPFFDRFLLRSRTRFGVRVLPMNEAFRTMSRERDQLTVTTFVADQSPDPQFAYLTQFFGRPTYFFDGFEKIAQKFNYPVFFVRISRLSRGKYLLKSELMEESPASLKKGDLCERYVRLLEGQIREQPEIWLWSHRRWKHQPKESPSP